MRLWNELFDLSPQFDQALLDRIAAEERELVFSRFSNEMGIAIGLELLARGRQRGLAIAVDVTRHGQCLFHAGLPGTSPDNDDWIRRKRLVVDRFGHSSLYIGTKLKIEGRTLEDAFILPPHSYAAHGGCVPILIRDTGPIGSVTVSGLPQIDDHNLVVEVLRAHLA